MSKIKTANSDITIVGGGLVGLSAALALQGSGQTIKVIEASSLHHPESGGLNARSIALSYSSIQIFRGLGVWQSIRNQAAAIRDIHVSSQGHWGVTRLSASELELDAMGYVIESRLLAASLLEKVEASEHIELLTGARFESIETGDEARIGYQIEGQRYQQLSSLAIIADGANSSARKQLGVEHNSVDYGQAAIITNLEFSKPVEAMAYERFTEQGPLAVLPLGGKRYACVWTRNIEDAEALVQLDDGEFIEELQRCFGFRMGYIEAIGQRFSFDLQRVQARRLISGHCLLIGNAANALHPVAGQGFNLALRDIATLYDLLGGQNMSDLDDETKLSLLAEYETNRKAEQNRVIRLGDGLVSLFSNQLPVLNHIRAGSLAALDLVPPLKTQVALAGMGMTFGGNALLRGHL
ncbi:MAG: FAD-dependent monooxygenase [Gammaproteobacteria bacterium]|nr:FAD-dependent monooxygenase [Gammaproteobacteria bacterium]